MDKNTRIYKFVFCGLCLVFSNQVLAVDPGDVLGDVQYERAEDADENELGMFPPTIFPHWKHRIHYRCDACHDTLFEMKKGGTPVTMELMAEGKVCGACHNGTVAFDSGYTNCNKCHIAYTK